MKIKAYLKPSCGWSNGVRAIFQKHQLAYEDVDIINNPTNYAEMVERSGQRLSPCVEIDGVMLADISGDEVEKYMLEKGLVKPVSAETDVPTNAPCTDEEHAKQRAKTIRFFWFTEPRKRLKIRPPKLVDSRRVLEIQGYSKLLEQVFLKRVPARLRDRYL